MTDFCRFPVSPRADMITGISLFGVFSWFGKDASWLHRNVLKLSLLYQAACVHICIGTAESFSLNHRFLLELLCQVHMAGLASQVKRYCDCYKRYAGHLDRKMRCFRGRMTANFRHGMVIPNKFIDHFGGNISRTIELESRNGSMYTVEVSKLMNETVLRRRGWQAFVDAHGVEENDSLLFRHIEKSCFEVLVLDSDDCEKVLPSAGIKVASCNAQESGSVDYIDISSSSGDDTTRSPGSQRFATCERGDSSHPRKTAVINDSLPEEDSGEDTDAAEEHSEHKSSFELDDVRQTPSAGRDYVLSRRGRLSGAQEERVTRLLQDVQAETPVFVAIMKMSTQNRTIVIPKLFAEEHFPRESQNLTLQRPGKSKKWHPWFSIRKDRCGHVLTGSRWVGFLRDNGVQEGDLCVFQPVQGTGTRSKFTVHLLHESLGASRSTGPKKRVGCTTTHGNTRVNSAAPERATTAHGHGATTMAKAAPPTPTTLRVNKQQDDGCNHGRQTQRTRQLPKLAPPYVISSAARLTEEQEREVDRTARAIGSQVPVYVSVMNRSSVGVDNGIYNVTISGAYAADYLPAGERVAVTLVRRKKVWEVEMRARNGGRTLAQGWCGFARDNRLRVQDVCLFQPMEKNHESLTMTVHIIRHSGKRQQ
ncbi:B3 domain-containing protein Os03g0620400 [Aegilops tauschii subsp. strangulata]|uniref:TF-B3 domain-containing protein n=3 Tax=Aegilops tauschii subsp. strangulata TaxID=200361 RepID=A0A453ECE7_AEGTS|nr:B3 domain-containing protein Os03g0620400 [Aegilops tauschii subsp. strangulata]